MAEWMNRVTLIRTLSHAYNSHNPYAVMTGFTGGNDREDYYWRPTDYPSMGSVATYFGVGQPGVPPYVVLPDFPGYTQALRRAGPYGGFLGRKYDPLFATADPTCGVLFGERRRFEGVALEQLTPNSLASFDALAEDLEATGVRGYAIDNQESSPEVICVASALVDARGEVVAGMSISVPVSRMTAEREAELAHMVMEGVRDLGARLGYPIERALVGVAR